jgi:hypothetical protein
MPRTTRSRTAPRRAASPTRRPLTARKPLRGNILPLALVIVTTILLAGIGLSVIILDSIRRSADQDASMLAYYAADGGVEQQLYAVRKQAYAVTSTQALSGTFSNNASWQPASSTYLQANLKIFSTTPSTSLQILDIYNPDNASAAGGVGRVDWSWTAGSDCPGGVAPEVELGYAEWLAGGSVIPNTFTIVRGITNTGMSTILNSSKGYRLRFRPKSCTANNLTIQTYDGSGTLTNVPGDITVGAVGYYGKASQAITVTMPRQDVLSGIFSYALFSECQLVKDPNNIVACP